MSLRLSGFSNTSSLRRTRHCCLMANRTWNSGLSLMPASAAPKVIVAQLAPMSSSHKGIAQTAV